MKIAWVSHHVPRAVPTDNPPAGLLPGLYAGGAEMADAEVLATCPADIDVHRISPNDWAQAMDYERIVITGTDLLTDTAMTTLATRRPLVWPHHQQTPAPSRRVLFESARPFLTRSKAHALVEAAWSGVESKWCHGAIDPDCVTPGVKQDFALWAGRDHPQKGRIGARIWAQRNAMPLRELTNVPRQQVLDAMAIAAVFVYLPKGHDTIPRTLIEAELAGCRIVTNNDAGRRDPGPIRDVLAAQITNFWTWTRETP